MRLGRGREEWSDEGKNKGKRGDVVGGRARFICGDEVNVSLIDGYQDVLVPTTGLNR
jgi:hypothetical protein